MLPTTSRSNPLSQLLDAVTQADWQTMPRKEFEALAKALWYGPTEDLAAGELLFERCLQANNLLVAGRLGYLFELFQTFRCNTAEKFAAMNALTYLWRAKLSLSREAKFASANTWGLNQTVEGAMPWVLEFQTRHYASAVLGTRSRYFNDF